MKHIYYGMGKGKTSTLNGSAIRAVGSGKRVGYFRFLKTSSSEDNVIKSLCDFKSFASYKNKFIWDMNSEEIAITKKSMISAFEEIKESINDKKYNFILLDEFTDLIQNKYLNEDEIVTFLNTIPDTVEVLMSGHHKHDKLFESIDLITHFVPEKHYFEKGVKARKGIEY